MAKSLRSADAQHRINNGYRGLGYWAARDFFKNIVGKPIADASKKEHHFEEHTTKKKVDMSVEKNAYDVCVAGRSCLMSTSMHEADHFYGTRLEKSPHTIEMFSISNGIRTRLRHHQGRGFRMDKIASFKVQA